MNDTPNETPREAGAYRALDMLHKSHPPKLKGRVPFWRPKAPEPTPRVHVPSWSWQRPISAWDDEYVTVLDANAAFLSAAASVEVGHGALQHTGAGTFDPTRPGYWLVEAHPWNAWDVIMSPLGGRPTTRERGRGPAPVWLTTPTVQLLAMLTGEGCWPGVEILDSWTADQGVRLRSWTSAVRRDRDAARDTGCDHPDDDATCCAPHSREAAIKTGYATAVVMLGLPERSPIYRPDWMYSIRAQFAFSTWLKAWRAVKSGYPIVGAGNVDELVFPRRTALQLWKHGREGRVVPIIIDVTGRILGSWKVKAGSVPTKEWFRG